MRSLLCIWQVAYIQVCNSTFSSGEKKSRPTFPYHSTNPSCSRFSHIMLLTVYTSFFIVYASISFLDAIPFPQYMPQGMGNHAPCSMGGYPQMKGGYPMNSGRVSGPAGNQHSGQMYLPGGEESNHHIHHNMMRGQRWHARPNAEDWPMTGNPYDYTRYGRHGSSLMPNRGGNMVGGPMVGPMCHNHIHLGAGMGDGIVGKGLDNGFSSSSGNNSGNNSDDDSNNDAGSATKDTSSKERQSGLLKKLSVMTDTNTSLDLASFSGRMLTIDALTGTLSTMSNSTAAPASTRSSVGKSVAVDTASSKVLTTKLALRPAATSSSPRGKVLPAKPCSPSAKLLPAKPGQTVHLPCHGPTPTGKVMSAKLTSTHVSAGSSSAGKLLSTKTSSKRVSMDIASNELPTTTTHFLATPRRLWSARSLSAKKTDRGLSTEQSAATPAHSPAARKIRGMY